MCVITETNIVAELSMNDTRLTSRIELSICAQGLISCTYPFLVLYQKGIDENEWNEIGRTEIIANNQNPEWVKRMEVIYYFEKVQLIRMEIYDGAPSSANLDTSKLKLSKQSLFGAVDSSLPMIVKTTGSFLSPIVTVVGSKCGSLCVRTEELNQADSIISMKLRCTSLKRIHTFTRKTTPYFLKIFKLREDGPLVPCYKTEVVVDDFNPTFAEITGSMVQICNGDFFRPLRISCYQYDSSKKEVLIGKIANTPNISRNSWSRIIEFGLQAKSISPYHNYYSLRSRETWRNFLTQRTY